MSEMYNGDPWTVGAEMRLRQKPGVTLVTLLTDEDGALLIAKGIVPGYVVQQAKDALVWCCTEERAAPAEKDLFDLSDEDLGHG